MSEPGGPPTAVVFDHTALLAAGTGNRLVSGLIAAAHRQRHRHVYAPAMCVVAATAVRPALGEHLGMLDAVQVVTLDYPVALSTGALIAAGVDWRAAHAIATARPTLEWPTGLPVVTASPQIYAPWGVPTITLDPALGRRIRVPGIPPI